MNFSYYKFPFVKGMVQQGNYLITKLLNYYITGLILNRGNSICCPFKSPNRNLQIPHRGALRQAKIALPLQV